MTPFMRIALYQLSETHHGIERRSKLMGQGGEELGSRPRDQLRVGKRTCLLLSHDLGGDVTVSSDECSDVAVPVVLTDSVGLHPQRGAIGPGDPKATLIKVPAGTRSARHTA